MMCIIDNIICTKVNKILNNKVFAKKYPLHGYFHQYGAVVGL